ncbi:hypothetical protein AO242_03380 [Pseudomonas sp. ICMP 561]|nr:hypothetical protein AO242_03380 [Pseudomonas sp. ICMP 561]
MTLNLHPLAPELADEKVACIVSAIEVFVNRRGSPPKDLMALTGRSELVREALAQATNRQRLPNSIANKFAPTGFASFRKFRA